MQTGHLGTLIATAMLAALPGLAQPLSFSLLRGDGVQPSPRLDGTIAYEAEGRRIFLFGGQDSEPRNDLWAYSLSRRAWEEVTVAGPRPPARFGHTLLFDPVRRRLVVFGGQASGFFSDVWAFDTVRLSWRQLAADEAGPSRRYGHSAIYDSARDRMVISHGFTSAGRFDDTWAFDFATGSWRDLSPSSGRPLRRCLHRAAYDHDGNQMYFYGGCASGFGPCPLGDLWAFDLIANRWTERTSQGTPPARQHYGMAFDAIRRRLVVFGGNGAGALNDTWDFDPRSTSWRQPAIAGSAPSPRHRHETAYAGDRGTIFFFGGVTSSGVTNELWMLGPGFVFARPEIAENGVVNAFSGQAGAVAPGEAVTIFGSGLGPDAGVALAFDTQIGALPVSESGVSAAWNGIPAPLYFVSSGQLNVQAPYELDGATEASLVVTANGQSSDPVTVPVTATRPGLFPRAWNYDGTLNSAENPGASGDVVVLYATGHGVTNPRSRSGALPGNVPAEPQAPVSVRIGGIEAGILFLGQAPGTAGVIQINVRVPTGVASGSHSLVVSIGAAQSQPGVFLHVR